VAIWNVGLDDADPQGIAAGLAAFQGVDVWGLAEVNRPSLAQALAQAAAEGEGRNFGYVLSDSGGGMRLLAIYDAERFHLLESWEIAAVNTTGNARAPLVLHLQERSTGFPFLFMVNHLYRSRDDERHAQAQLLNEWAAKQQLPVVAVGDYNFDWEIVNGAANHDWGYDLLTAQGALDVGAAGTPGHHPVLRLALPLRKCTRFRLHRRPGAGVAGRQPDRRPARRLPRRRQQERPPSGAGHLCPRRGRRRTVWRPGAGGGFRLPPQRRPHSSRHPHRSRPPDPWPTPAPTCAPGRGRTTR
jgi:hypothetical protein